MMDFKKALVRKRFLKINTTAAIVIARRSTVYCIAAFMEESRGEMWLNSLHDPVYRCGLLQIPSLGLFATEKSGRALSFNPIACFPELHLFGVNSFVCTSICDSHQQPHVIYPTVKHLLCNALMKASGGRIDKPFLTTAA